MTTLVRWCAGCAFGLLATATAVAGPWEPLFNGRDLTGWNEINGTAPSTTV